MNSMDIAMTQPIQPYAPGNRHTIKHLFVMMYLHPDWIHHQSSIAVNELNQISYNGGAWHGEATFESDRFWGGRWVLNFYTDDWYAPMVLHLFVQVRGTTCYLNIESPSNCRYNAILMPSPADQF